MKRAVVVGSGAGGATAAKELQGAFEVTVIEAGKEFRRFSYRLPALARWKKLGLFFDERTIRLLFPAMRIVKSDDMILVYGKGLGGTTTIATGNAVRLDDDLKRLGIDLDPEFTEIRREIPISTAHEVRWRPATRRLHEICGHMGLSPQVTPKMGDYRRCRQCGRCILGCPYGIKWDSRTFLREAESNGARVLTRRTACRLVIENEEARGVEVRTGWRRQFLPADLVVLAAGGLGTPPILERSGIAGEPRLFVDPVLTVAAEWPEAELDTEVPMPFIIDRGKYIIAPYFDYLSFLFNSRWSLPSRNILSLMIKLADEPNGTAGLKGVRKELSAGDRDQLAEAVSLSTEILCRFGIRRDAVFLGTINAGHPGGMFPLGAGEKESFHHPALPLNVYVADASLFPSSLGKPPILTIIAMAKRVCRLCRGRLS